VSFTLSGQVQKGPFAIGSAVAANELDTSLNPTGKVYNSQTSDDLGNFAVSSKIGTNLVELVADGFYMDELTGQLASSRIQLRAVADLSVDTTPTVNILTSLQSQRLKKLITQGSSYSAAYVQSQNEVLTAFGIDPTKINALSTLYAMQINGSSDADSVLLATSTILSKMATNAAVANSTTQPAELSNYISTIAAQIANTGTITNTAIITARNLAASQINLVAVRTNVESYYANRGVMIVAPKFEEWVDLRNSGILPQRLLPVSGLTFTNVNGVSPGQLITSDVITVAGLGAGVVVSATVNVGTILIKNNIAVIGNATEVQDGDMLAMRVTSLGFGLTNTSTISVGLSSSIWTVTSQQLSVTISGLLGSGLVLQNNGGDNVTVPANSVNSSFNAPIPFGTNYNVSVLVMPSNPAQVCSVMNNTGTVSSNVSNVSVNCFDAGASLITKMSGDSQTIAQYLNLPSPLVVLVSDAIGAPVSGVPVSFSALTIGSGYSSPIISTTDQNGLAVWNGYFRSAGSQAVSVTVAGITGVTFNTVVTASTHIYDGQYSCSFLTPLEIVSGTLPSAPAGSYPNTVQLTINEADGAASGGIKLGLGNFAGLSGQFLIDANYSASGFGTTWAPTVPPSVIGNWTCQRIL
jgi:hypothetical protein